MAGLGWQAGERCLSQCERACFHTCDADSDTHARGAVRLEEASTHGAPQYVLAHPGAGTPSSGQA